MKKIKLATLCALSALFAINTVNAAPTQPANQAQTQSKAQQVDEKRLNSNVGIGLLERGARDQDGKITIFNGYTLTNKSKSPIKSLEWQIVYTIDNKPVYFQNVTFAPEAPLGGKQATNVMVELPFDILPPELQQQLRMPNVQMFATDRVTSITFANGFKMEAKQ